MNGFDRNVILWLNQFARREVWFDELMVLINRGVLVKGGVAMTLTWWLWFRPREDLRSVRTGILTALLGGFVSLMTGRALALLLPFRVRPIHDSSLGFVMPFATGPGDFRGWSSFPSDHAMMYFAIAVGLGFVSRGVGIFLTLWTLIVVCLPRVYAGLHYPTDILGGALTGCLIAWLLQRPPVRERLGGTVLEWSERHPAPFFAAMFLVTFGISNMFTDARQMVQFALDLVRRGRG